MGKGVIRDTHCPLPAVNPPRRSRAVRRLCREVHKPRLLLPSKCASASSMGMPRLGENREFRRKPAAP